MALGDPRDWGDWSQGPFDTLEEERRAKMHKHLGGPCCEICRQYRYQEDQEVLRKIVEAANGAIQKKTGCD